MVWYISAGTYIWELFKIWINTLFVLPFQKPDMLWLLGPIWLSWVFAEFFQEKTGTSMGNAISNAVVGIWASVDCGRQTVNLIKEGILGATWDIVMRFSLIAGGLIYSFIIVILGWLGKPIIKYIGRVREITYIFVTFVPIFYNAIPFSLEHILAAVVFFPAFYFAIELIDRLTPNPKAVEEDIVDKEFGGLCPLR